MTELRITYKAQMKMCRMRLLETEMVLRAIRRTYWEEGEAEAPEHFNAGLLKLTSAINELLQAEDV